MGPDLSLSGRAAEWGGRLFEVSAISRLGAYSTDGIYCCCCFFFTDNSEQSHHNSRVRLWVNKTNPPPPTFSLQIQALTWVHDNIAHFGGDPDKVTVFGQGTGGTSVALHLMSPKSKDLFQRAIIQSGAASAPYQPRKAANESVQKLAAAANCPFNDNLLTCLRSKSAEEIIQLQSSISSKDAKALMELSNPVIDDDFLEESTQKLYEYHKRGKKLPQSFLKKLSPNVEIMIGCTTYESSLDVIQRPEDVSQDGNSRSSIVKTLKYGNVDNKIVEELVKYQYADHSDTKARDRMIESDFMTVAPMTFEAIALAEVFSVAIIIC